MRDMVGLGARQIRGVAAISLAVLAVISVSIAYLRPPAARPAPAIPVVTQQQTQWLPAQHLNFTGRTDGGYFVWHVPGAGSGGHP